MTKSESLTIRLEPDILQELERMAALEDRPVSNLALRILKDAINEKKKAKPVKQKGRDDAV